MVRAEPAELCPPRFDEKSHSFGAYTSTEIADRLPKWVERIEECTGKGKFFNVPRVVYLKDGSRVINPKIASFLSRILALQTSCASLSQPD